MTPFEIGQAVDSYLDSRNLKNPDIRKRALRKVLEFIAKNCTHSGQVSLPANKEELKDSYKNYKGANLSGAESSVINHIYELFHSSICQCSFVARVSPAIPKIQVLKCRQVIDITDIERKLISGTFTPVNSLNERNIPTSSGIYCIKLRKGVVFPANYGKIREDGIIYIGK